MQILGKHFKNCLVYNLQPLILQPMLQSQRSRTHLRVLQIKNSILVHSVLFGLSRYLCIQLLQKVILMKVTEIAGYKQVSSRMPIGVRELWKKAQVSGKILKPKPFPGSGRFLAGGHHLVNQLWSFPGTWWRLDQRHLVDHQFPWLKAPSTKSI